MLQERRKEAHVGFSDLAESNKEMKSLKSGDLHRERSQMLFSKQSMRSRISRDGTAAGNRHVIFDKDRTGPAAFGNGQSSLEPGMGDAQHHKSFDVTRGSLPKLPPKFDRMNKTGMTHKQSTGGIELQVCERKTPDLRPEDDYSDTGYRHDLKSFQHKDYGDGPDIRSAE